MKFSHTSGTSFYFHVSIIFIFAALKFAHDKITDSHFKARVGGEICQADINGYVNMLDTSGGKFGSKNHYPSEGDTTATPRTTTIKNEFIFYLRISRHPKVV